MDTPDWLRRARPVDEPVLEVGFAVHDDYYYGPENGFPPEAWRTMREPLRQPALPFHHNGLNYVLTPMLRDGTGEMVSYYQDVLRLARKHGRVTVRPYFRLRVFLFSASGFDIPFYFHYTPEDIEWLLARLQAVEEGEVYDDVDQGWQVDVFATGGRLYMRHTDFDTGEEFACGWMERAPLVRQIAPLRARLHAALAEMETALGRDLWSQRPRRRPPR